jgi:alkylhydroperoxidase family enzyme
MNHEDAYAEHRDVQQAWLQLNGAIKASMDLRRYELVTLAAALRLRSSYCSLAHGKVLVEMGEPVLDVVRDRASSGLSEADLAVMAFAERIVDDAESIVDADREELRRLGLSDKDIFDVALAAGARCFYSKVLDAAGVHADASFRDLDADLRDALTVGKAIAEA